MIELADINPILAEQRLPGAVAMHRLTGGHAMVFRVDLADETTVLLKGFPTEHAVPHHDAYAAQLLSGLGLPITRFLLIDETLTRLPFRFALTTFLHGQRATTFAEHPRYMDVFRQLGAVAKTLHSVNLPAFGQLPQTEYATNTAYIRDFAEGAFDRFLHYGAEPGLTTKLRTIFESRFDAIVPVTRKAVYAHDDLHPDNILVTESGGELTISGLIDFGNVRSSAGVMDLAKAIFCSEHMAPGCRDAILDGYGRIDHPAPDAALEFYTLLHRIIMWWWLRHTGTLPSADTPSNIMDALRIAASAG